jgi:hypothetical protein
MSVSIVYNDGKHFYLGSNSSSAAPELLISNTSPLIFPLFKTNDVVVSWHGKTPPVAHLYAGVDWTKIKSPLSESMLFHYFYEPFFKALKRFDMLTPGDDNLLFDYSISIFFITKNQCFCFDKRGITEIEEIDTMGTGSSIAFDAYEVLCKQKIDGFSLVKAAVEATIKNTNDTAYPILLLRPEDKDLTMIEESGKITKVKIPTIQELRGKD